MMTAQSAQSFAVWLLKEHPAVFYAIAKHEDPNLGAFSDILSNIGSAFSTAVSSVSKFVGNPENVKSLTSLASTYFAAQGAKANANAQSAILDLQLQRAQAGQPAAPIAYTYGAQDQPIPVYTGSTPLPALGQQMSLPSGQTGYTITPQALNALSPSFIQKYGLWLGAGAVALLLGLALLR